jgi:UDP-N-acetylmuramate--alanine ligase
MNLLPTHSIDLSTPVAVHVVGCGGAGMAPITAVLHHMGHSVTGSDQRSSPTLGALEALGIPITFGADYDRIPHDAVIVRSTAVPSSHPEVAHALHAGRVVHRRSDILAAITAEHRTIAVAGTHGKTTTSSMIVAALLGAGIDVTSIIGGRLIGIEQVVPGAVLGGQGAVLVVEADESDGTFVELAARIAVVTNIEPDHLEFYGGQAGLFSAFDRFIANETLETIVACGDDERVRAALARRRPGSTPPVTYGSGEATDVRLRFERSDSAVIIDGTTHPLRLGQPGLHNALNATAALAVVHAMGGDVVRAAAALGSFGGVGRRFEIRGVVAGVTVVDDYAHLQGEIQAAICAARDIATGRVLVAFQPHRFSRTEALWPTYAAALSAADAVVITDIYTAGEPPRKGISADLVYDDLLASAPDLDVVRVGPPADVPAALAGRAAPGDVCLLLSAGDLPNVSADVLAAVRSRADGR